MPETQEHGNVTRRHSAPPPNRIMTRGHDILTAYAPTDPEERRFKVRMLALLANAPRAFWRDTFTPGHFTGSGLVASRRYDKVLLMRHKLIGRWMQFGGHADGETDLAKVALREASEESGFAPHCFTLRDGILDIDIHPIPPNAVKGEPAHEHFDVRYLLELDDALPLPPNPEGLALRWLPLAHASAVTSGDPGLVRMLSKLACRARA